ncbi:LacI family transcriptional regulator [Paenibacillus dendritiformis]|uniref:LacI family DNA-binding transcriptional regulator n=1 Tax=Paenibacillus dendritiformis TaxID=130049 RepID=UPI0018CE9B46|nr:LacI family DNA-binding transcriptional regulator [Paenibacillus dendritiformis]MBG9796075.1 LacI family transcriptional regulator [Paenibacillus dendritiformis]
MKKTTIKDIAKAAGVSIATVSYILNDVKTQSISNETRVKVLKIAQQLKYVPNRTAQSLKIKKTGLIGILVFKDERQSPWSAFKYAKTISKIEQQCSALGYHVIFMQIDDTAPSYKVIMERNLDGVFLINVDQERFSAITPYFGFGIPVFVVDSYIEDSLFHKIMPDVESGFQQSRVLLGEAPQFLVMDRYNNERWTDFIKEASGLPDERIHVYERRQGMEAFLARFKGRPGIVMNEFIANEAVQAHSNLMVLCTCHCPEIVHEAAAKISFNLDLYAAFVKVMNSFIHDAEYVHEEKFLTLPLSSQLNEHVQKAGLRSL